ncbi:stromal processing peptidase, chloroplastic-like isoform X2 [Malus domestica]|uniref:stromal processing peptidase, chloroplastic-like isoform X2 n=1 Tax=Malus domestica TaxID=3750 RepID=UPI0039767900
MAAISSLVVNVPLIRPSQRISRDDDTYSNRRLNSVFCVRSARGPLTLLHINRLSLFSPTRRLLEAGAGRSGVHRKKINTWEQCVSMLGEPVTDALFPGKYNCITSSFCQNRSRHHCRTSTPRVFNDKTSFCLFKPKLGNVAGKHAHVSYATVGPDEPHAASTAWQDGLLEKQELDLLYPGVEKTELEGFLSSEIPSHPKLYRGQLKNGLRYVILPNKVPPNRFEAHMEVHSGSIDEQDDEQGVAHMIEHVAFLGSKKREKLLGTGARSNAYTDFHHTVFHIHSPISSKDSDGDLLPYVLDALNEIAFHPKFLSSRVEKERHAILSELQMMNTIDYRVDCQVPVSRVQTYGDLRNVLMKRIFLSALHFRINTRYKSSNPPFTSIELDHSDSGREGCTVTTLTVTAEPKNWQGAIRVAVQEVRRLKEFGVTKGELTRYMDALLKDSEHLAAMIDNVSSVDNLDFIMESDALGHTVMDQRQGHESLVAVAGTVTLEEVNSIGAKVLEFVSNFGNPTAPLPAAIVACVPKRVHVEGIGETEFTISSNEIIAATKAGLEEPIEPEPELEVPKELISSLQLQELRQRRMPSFIPCSPEINVTKVYDKETGITKCRLSNGISVNYKISKSEAMGGVMRLIVGGGRAAESSESRGSVVVGVRTLSEGGRVGNFSREQVELFCMNHLINCSLESTEEFISMEFRFTLRDNGMRAAFQLLHMVLEHSVWLDDAFDRARQLYLSYYQSIPKSLERSTAHKLMLAMMDGDERFVEPTPKSLQNLTLQSVKDAVMNQFVGSNMEVSIVGDFSEEDVESCILDYLGTVRSKGNYEMENAYNPIVFRSSPSDLQSQQVFLKDTDERACAYIAGPAPNRWGFTVDGKDLFESFSHISTHDDAKLKSEEVLMVDEDTQKDVQRKLCGHPLFFGITMGLLAEIINSRLFTTVRDSLGLTYDVSFELNLFDRLNLGWYVISVTSTPVKVHKAVDACKNVLRGLHGNKICQRELDRAKRTLLMRHEAEIKSNAYWLGLLAHLQASSVPRKDISCIKDLTNLYEVASIDDIYLAYDQLKVGDDSLYSCIGVAGAQAGDEITEVEESVDGFPGIFPVGRGLSTMTRPTT